MDRSCLKIFDRVIKDLMGATGFVLIKPLVFKNSLLWGPTGLRGDYRAGTET